MSKLESNTRTNEIITRSKTRAALALLNCSQQAVDKTHNIERAKELLDKGVRLGVLTRVDGGYQLVTRRSSRLNNINNVKQTEDLKVNIAFRCQLTEIRTNYNTVILSTNQPQPLDPH